MVDLGGARSRVRLDLLDEEVRPGDYLLVHTGFAIRRLDQKDALETLKIFEEMLSFEEGDEYRDRGV